MKTVLVAGATGYLGRHLVKRYMSMGWQVRALVRNAQEARASGLEATEIVAGLATDPISISGLSRNADLVVSALGITRQRDGFTYRDVDYQANANLLADAVSSGVAHFAYVHVLNADKMLNVPLVAAKQAFVDELTASPIKSTIIAPSGFFSDMSDFIAMARNGRMWLFGSGDHRLNPIDGADLAVAISEAIADKVDYFPVGGPEIFTQNELAKAAFAALGKEPRITRLPDGARRLAIKVLPFITPSHIHGPALFFLSAMGLDMVGEPRGSRRLADHFSTLA